MRHGCPKVQYPSDYVRTKPLGALGDTAQPTCPGTMTSALTMVQQDGLRAAAKPPSELYWN